MKTMNIDTGRYLTGMVLLALGGTAPALAVENNLRLHGALVTEPCVLPPGDEDVKMDFGAITDKGLYKQGRTAGQRFAIQLAECDPAISKTVSVTFRGTENPALPGLLAIDGGSEATGVAIGLETPAAKPLLLNQASDRYRLQEGSNVIALKAYVRGEPKAIAEKAIGHGPFSAVVTFVLKYE